MRSGLLAKRIFMLLRDIIESYIQYSNIRHYEVSLHTGNRNLIMRKIEIIDSFNASYSQSSFLSNLIRGYIQVKQA